jgi:thiol:disulfide interchange protein
MLKKTASILLTIPILLYANITWTSIATLPNNQTLTHITQTLPNGWHSYWKYPGDSGAPATVTSLSKGLTLGNIIFPRPSVISTGELTTYGYEGTIIYKLPISLPKTTHKPITMQFNWLECTDICIPKTTTLSLTHKQNLPKTILPSPQPHTVQVSQQGNRLVFSGFQTTLNQADFFPYTTETILSDTKQKKNKQLSYKRHPNSPNTIEGALYINKEQQPYIINATVVARAHTPLLLTLCLAFIGGLLLNIMPCVLPVIGIKALQLQQKPQRSPLKQALNYCSGVILSLLGLFTILSGLKLAGHTVGWGFQLQSPFIIQSLILLFLILMLSNLELILIQAPKALLNIQNKYLNMDNMFWYGVLTTIIATPCTAPFLGAALSIALFQSLAIGTAIFTCIGLGLATPMTMMIVRPNNRQWLPTSGTWNQRFKFTLSFGFVATIIWLIWILSAQVSTNHIFAFISACTCLCIVLITKKQTIKSIKKARTPLIITLIGCLLITINTPSKPSNWTPYTKNNVLQLESTNTPYFIDVTAKWCLTCQTNKRFVLNTKKAHALFKSKNLVLIRADWTNHDPAITALLTQFNQISIPTYIYFDGTKHMVFGDILTNDILRKKLSNK